MKIICDWDNCNKIGSYKAPVERDNSKKYKLLCLEHIKIFKVANINTTLKFLREKNFWIYGFDSKSKKDFTEFDWKGNNVLLFGSEGFGIKKHTEKYTDFSTKIEINKDIESLNISNSAAIVFHHIMKRKKDLDQFKEY